MEKFSSGCKANDWILQQLLCQKKGKRIALLIICQYDTRQIQSMIDGSIEQLEKVAKTGIEFWIAETKTGEDGIRLMSYQNFTDNILKG